jgi:hypothetical protein
MKGDQYSRFGEETPVRRYTDCELYEMIVKEMQEMRE